ncbi:MAG: phosphate ABC transporter permease PstA [Halococcoides sp.]
MSTQTTNSLVTGDGSIRSTSAIAVVGLGVAVALGGWFTLFQWIDETTTIAGVPLFPAFGGAILAMAGILAILGLGSWFEAIDTTPSATAGLSMGVAYGGLGIVGGAIAVGAIGLPAVAALVVAPITGLALGSIAALAREDIGATVPPAIVLAGIGGVIASGLIDAAWSWSTASLSVTFVGGVVVPGLAVVAGVLGAYSGARVRRGFGARGRQDGSIFLITATVAGMLGILVLLIGFIVTKGLATVLRGGSLLGGRLVVPVLGVGLPMPELPFVTNVTRSIYVDVPGVMPAVVGTLWLVVGAVVLAVPLGVGAAIFLTEYAEQGRFTQVVDVATNGLWSTPSIVFGLFGLAFLVPRISGGRSLIVGQLVLGFMLLPLVLITSRESIKAVPDDYRDASAALGVSRWETIRSVVLPAAMPGIATGVILGVGRIAGETAPLLLVTGGQPFPSTGPGVLSSFAFTTRPPFITNDALLSRASALPYQLYTTITSGHVPGETFTVSQFGWGTALVLLAVVIGLYAIGIATRTYFRRTLNE